MGKGSLPGFNMKLFFSLCLVVLLSLQYKLWFMQDGIVTSWQLKSAVANKMHENELLLARNNKLSEEIKAWKTGAGMIEAHARYELGMVKEGEIFYRIVK
jgi:cell division protein FtsB